MSTQKPERVIWLLLAASFVVILNETIMSVAIPELMTDLRIDAQTAQWLTTGFMLTMAIVIPITGFLIQRFSTRTVFLSAMSFFSLGTLIAASAPGFEILLLGRIVQAFGTAMMMPLLMTTVMTLVAPQSRGKTMGNISIVIAVAPAIGPTVSGIILNTLTWRWMFWIVLPISLVMLFIGYKKVTNVSEPKKMTIDVLSVVLAGFGFGGTIYGLSNMSGIGIVVGSVALFAFIWRQIHLQKSDRALLDLRTFKVKNFTVSMTIMMINTIALFGTIILLPIYLQKVVGLEPLQVGLMLLPGGVVMGLMAPLVGRFYDRFGPKLLVVPGTFIVTGVLASFAFLQQNTAATTVLISHIILSFGLALIFTPLFSAGLGSVKSSLYSHASATVGTVQQVAGAAGTALFITVMTINSLGDSPEQLIVGVRAAFMTGAIVSAFAFITSLFINKPAD